MIPDRRSLLAAGAALALAPPAEAAWPGRKPKPPLQGRAAYAGPPLHPQLGDWRFEAAARSGAARTFPYASDDLDERLAKAAAAMKTLALTAALARPDGAIWTQTLTAARDPVPPSRFLWASVAKAYTATVILQLADEGKLNLDQTLDRWAPDMPNAAWITVEDLLAHTSGLFSFQSDPALRAEPGYKPPERLLAVAAVHPPVFRPGQAWGYCNTGYVLLGRIVEAVDGRPWHEALTARIVERLELRETTLLAPRQVLPGLAPWPPSAARGGTDDEPTTPYAAGALAASAADVVRFWRAVLADRLHSQASTRRRFYRLYPMTGGRREGFYGLGVMVSDLALIDPRATDTWLGHAGGLPGAAASVAYSMEKRAFVAVALTGEGSPEAAANLLLAGLKT